MKGCEFSLKLNITSSIINSFIKELKTNIKLYIVSYKDIIKNIRKENNIYNTYRTEQN